MIAFISAGHLVLSSEKGMKKNKLLARLNVILIKNELLFCIMVSDELNLPLFAIKILKVKTN